MISALKDDKPYDQFVLEQLAADQFPDARPNDPRLATLGFLTVGKRFDNPHDVTDEQIDATTRAFLGLTVSCARCHDHKFDPVPIADYYSLHGIFASTEERYEKPTLPTAVAPLAAADYHAKLADLERRNRDFYYGVVQKLLDQFERQLEARVVLHGWIAAHGHESPEAFAAKKRYGIGHEPEIDFQIPLSPKDPVWGPFNALAALARKKPDGFAALAPPALRSALAEPNVNPQVTRVLASLRPASLDDIGVAYSRLFAEFMPKIHEILSDRRAGRPEHSEPYVVQLATSIWPVPVSLDIAMTEQLMAQYQRLRLIGRTARSFLFTDINTLRMTHPGAPGAAMDVHDVAEPADIRAP